MQFDNLAILMKPKEGDCSEEGTTKEFWRELLQNKLIADDLSEFLELAEIMLVLPVGSVANERAFSLMNLLKSDLRNRLQAPHLNAALRATRSEHSLRTLPVAGILKEFRASKDRRMLRL